MLQEDQDKQPEPAVSLPPSSEEIQILNDLENQQFLPGLHQKHQADYWEVSTRSSSECTSTKEPCPQSDPTSLIFVTTGHCKATSV